MHHGVGALARCHCEKGDSGALGSHLLEFARLWDPFVIASQSADWRGNLLDFGAQASFSEIPTGAMRPRNDSGRGQGIADVWHFLVVLLCSCE